MNIVTELPNSICLSHKESEWNKLIDYEHIRLRCCNFHEHSHLLWDFPKNKALEPSKPEDHKDKEGLSKDTPNKRTRRKQGESTLKTT